MPQCVICKYFYPPTFTINTDDKKAKKCVFCAESKNSFETTNRNGEKVVLTKNEVIEGYKKYLKKTVNENDRIKKIVTDNMEKMHGEE